MYKFREVAKGILKYAYDLNFEIRAVTSNCDYFNHIFFKVINF